MQIHRNGLKKFKNFLKSIDRTGIELSKMYDGVLQLKERK